MAEAPGEKTLQPEDRDEGVVEGERGRRDEPPAQHPAGEPPPEDAGQVEVLAVPQGEPRRSELVRQLARRVAPMVAEGRVERPVDPGERRDEQQQPAARPEQRAHHGEGALVVPGWRHRRRLGAQPAGAGGAGGASLSYLLSLRYRVDGSMPNTSAARVLLPPSAWSTH